MSDSDDTVTFGWDASHYDAPPTARDGIGFYVHKACEGHRYYTDGEYGPSLNAARQLGIPILGAYFVLHGGTASDQVDFLLAVLDKATPWWRTHAAWMLQIDAEKFEYMDRAPTIAEVNAFADEYVRRTGRPAASVFAYAPNWLYGSKVSGLRYALWASSYGSNPTGRYPGLYPGNDSTRWAAYGGKTPLILQYGSRTTIAGQTTCDANAFRGTLAELTALVTGDDMPTPAELWSYKIPSPGLGVEAPGWDAATWLKKAEDYGRQILAALGASAVREKALATAIDALATGGGVDSAPILAKLTELGQEFADEIGQLRAALAEREAEADHLRAELARVLADGATPAG